MKKSFDSIINESLNAISSFLSGTGPEENLNTEKIPNSEKNENVNDQDVDSDHDDSVFYDIEQDEDCETILFDDSASFSQEVILNKEKNEQPQEIIDKTINGESWNNTERIYVEKFYVESLQSKISELEQSLEISELKVKEFESSFEKDDKITQDSSINKSQRFQKSDDFLRTGRNSITLESSLTNKSFTETNRLLLVIKEKDSIISDLQNKMEHLYSEKSKLETSLDIMEKDLVRTNENKENYILLAEEKMTSLNNVIESLRDQLEFERSKNYKIRNDLNDTRKKCIEMVEAVEIISQSYQ